MTNSGTLSTLSLPEAPVREVDFLITERENPLLLIECKLSKKAIVRDLKYFKSRPAGSVGVSGS